MKKYRPIFIVVVMIVLIIAIFVFAYFEGKRNSLIISNYSFDYFDNYEDDAENALAKIFAEKHNQPIEQTNVKITNSNSGFVSGSISFGPNPAEGGVFLARMANMEWLVDYEGNGSVNCLQMTDLGYPGDVLLGFCDFTDAIMNEAQAREIAEANCIKGGESLMAGTYNPNSKTWWFDANLNTVKDGCNPACVVSEITRTAEINWRCTGLIVPTE